MAPHPWHVDDMMMAVLNFQIFSLECAPSPLSGRAVEEGCQFSPRRLSSVQLSSLQLLGCICYDRIHMASMIWVWYNMHACGHWKVLFRTYV